MIRLRTATAAALAGCAAACASHAFVKPAGPSAPEPSSAAIWQQASSSCRETTTVHASFAMSGRFGGRGIPGLAGARLFLVADGARVGLEARVAGQLAFRLGGGDPATLLLAADRRVVVAPVADIMDALIGIPLDARQLLSVVAGCVSRDAARSGLRYGRLVEIITPDAQVYLEPRGSTWQVRAGDVAGVMVDYQRGAGGALERIAFRSEAAPGRIALTLRVESMERNAALDPSMFEVTVPGDARTMSLDELRAFAAGKDAS